jgi:hypothetical protein
MTKQLVFTYDPLCPLFGALNCPFFGAVSCPLFGALNCPYFGAVSCPTSGTSAEYAELVIHI